jgi:hypothetical protein
MTKTVVLSVVLYDVNLGLSSGERTYIEGCVHIILSKWSTASVKIRIRITQLKCNRLTLDSKIFGKTEFQLLPHPLVVRIVWNITLFDSWKKRFFEPRFERREKVGEYLAWRLSKTLLRLRCFKKQGITLKNNATFYVLDFFGFKKN